MKILLSSIILLILVWCAPQKPAPVPGDIIELLNSTQAIQDWKYAQDCTDGCSSPWVVSWASYIFTVNNWDDCCWQHDFDYKMGYKYGITKEMADYELWECVKASNHPLIAGAMYDAVSLFGGQYYQQIREK